MKKITMLSILLLFMFCFNVTAADICISPTGSGAKTGADWNNPADWSTLAFRRGDTYYLANGAYAGKTLNTNESGSTYINIYKATISVHGPSTGWADSMGDGQATIYGLSFTKGYYVIDGVTGTGSNNATYGIKLTPNTSCTGSDGDAELLTIPYNTMADTIANVTISHIAFIGCGPVNGDATTDGMIAIKSIPNVSTVNLTISNNYFSGFHNNIHAHLMTYANIYGNYFANNWSSSSHHGEQMALDQGSSHNKIYKNIFKNTNVYLLGMHYQGATNDDNYFYTNIVDGSPWVAALIGNADSAVADGIWRMYVYNNTFLNISSAAYGLFFPGILTGNTDGSKNTIVKNNIFYNITGSAGAAWDASGVTSDYNAYYSNTHDMKEIHGVYGTGSPLNNAGGGDYSLKAGSTAINMGETLSSPYNIDYNGNTRGVDGRWDIGAFEAIIGSSLRPMYPTIQVK